jgi:hypothetical protein
MRFEAAAALVVAVALSAGCAINPPLRVADAMPARAGSGVLLLDVPFHPQTEMQCGPAALATVLGASGVEATPEALAPQVYLPEREGSLQLELVGATRRAGRIPYRVERTPDALLAELEAGRPVLVLQNLLVRTFPKWHYAVLVGADPQGNRMILNSGEERGLQMRAPSFLRTWDWGGRWAIVALRPGELPAQPDPTTYLTAVADFEGVAGAAAAKPAWRSAIERWPSDPRPHLALGNQAHAAGDDVAAVRHYRAGLRLAPGDPVLGNNAASVLAKLGCRREARAVLAAARDDLAEDSPWRGNLEQTARDVESARRRSKACDALR